MRRARTVPAAAVLGLVLATLFWAGNYVVGAVAVETMSPLELTYWRWVIAAVPLLVIAQVVEHPDWGRCESAWPDGTGATVSLVFIGIFPSVGAYLLWNMALRAVPAGRAGVFLNLITVFTVAISLVLGEPLFWEQVAGGALVFGGIALVSTGPIRARGGTTRQADHVSRQDVETAGGR